MKDEIKEKFCSLEELKRTIDCYDGYLDNEEIYYFIGALRFAYNCITNLQEENERLKLELSGYTEAILRDDKLLGLQDYKKRNKKAIEYIDKHTIEWVDNKFKEHNIMVKFNEYSNPQALKDILGGDE